MLCCRVRIVIHANVLEVIELGLIIEQSIAGTKLLCKCCDPYVILYSSIVIKVTTISLEKLVIIVMKYKMKK